MDGALFALALWTFSAGIAGASTTTDALDGRCGAVRIVNPELRNSLTGMRTRKPKLPPDGAGDTLPSSGGNGLMHGAAGTA